MRTIPKSEARSPKTARTPGSCALRNVFGTRSSVLGLLLACVGIPGFAARLSATEPALSQTTAAAPPATPAPAAVQPAPAAHRERLLAEAGLLDLLTSMLQQEYVKSRGELELRLSQPWKAQKLPDEPLALKLLDMPAAGVTPMFTARFELCTATKSLGTWQMPVQARVWRDVWVARSALQRGGLVADADIARERRDVLSFHEPVAEFAAGDSMLELAESLQAGAPLLARSIKTRPVLHRGQTADALVRDGTLSITMKVEVLEDGAPGQFIRVRNSQSRRDIRGRVLNDQTILVAL